MSEAQFREYFEKHDTDKSGTLSQAEVKKMLAEFETSQETCEAVAKQFVEQFGGDDKAVSFDEFMAVFQKC